MTRKLALIAVGTAAIFGANWLATPWWGYVPGVVVVIGGLVSLGTLNSEPDASGWQKWGDGSGGGSGG